jgi:methylmalonyl-CoA mutase cobalamin-binding domain/chain
VVVGGIVPDEDEQALHAAGVAQVFHPGAARDDIIGTVARLAREARTAAA